MLIQELFEPNPKQVVVIYPGRFQPFHRGHLSVYNHLTSLYENVFICTSNKIDKNKSPFSFDEKRKIMENIGIDKTKIIQSRQPYKAHEVLENYDPNNTIAIFAISDKDMIDNPRFSFNTTSKGNQSYFQPLPESIDNAKSFNEHGYIITVPTTEFKVLGQVVKSASQIRDCYSNSDINTRKLIIKDLYESYDNDIFELMQLKFQ